jgi:hypothetical protein
MAMRARSSRTATAAAVDKQPLLKDELAGAKTWPHRRPLAARSKPLDPETTGWCEMPTAAQTSLTQLHMNRARCRALFSSRLQPSDTPTADMVATAISSAVQQFGIGGCAPRMAQGVRRPSRCGRQPDALGPPARRPGGLQPSGRRPGRNQTCDRCGPAVRAAYRASRSGQLHLCGHCTNQLRPALSAQGWTIWQIAKPAVGPPGSEEARR